MENRKLPIGIQSFENIRKGDYVYVDKTEYIRQLVETGKVYFLSRPRRFGKSLLLTTMEAYFRGQKDLFHGLSIEAYEEEKKEEAWQTYPVIGFYLSGGEYNTEHGLENTLAYKLNRCEEEYGIEHSSYDLANRFRYVIEQLYVKTGHQVVVLVDEYDKPLLETMMVNPAQEEKNRQLYKSFFSVLKDEDKYLKFVFFTGVTRFGKVSIFSDLNQLKDISLSEEYAGICGITEEEARKNFAPEIENLAKSRGMTEKACIEALAKMYDGYHFAPEGAGVYNPFSLLNALRDRDLRQYWFETGTPTFLIRKLKNSTITAENLVDGVERDELSLLNYTAEDPDPVPLYYQAGYLTIKGFDREFRIYSLVFPNDEVRYGFLKSLMPFVLGDQDTENPLTLRGMVMDLRKGDVEAFLDKTASLFAGIPYAEGKSPEYEREWRNQIYLILKLLGQNVRCEVHSAQGRADCIVETNQYVYILEFKLDRSAEEALEQIREKGYATPYRSDSRKVYEVGVNFSTEKRNIEEWRVRGDIDELRSN